MKIQAKKTEIEMVSQEIQDFVSSRIVPLETQVQSLLERVKVHDTYLEDLVSQAAEMKDTIAS